MKEVLNILRVIEEALSDLHIICDEQDKQTIKDFAYRLKTEPETGKKLLQLIFPDTSPIKNRLLEYNSEWLTPESVKREIIPIIRSTLPN